MDKFFRTRGKSFQYAFSGLRYALRTQKNSWIHLFFTIAAICAGVLLKITALEWTVIIFCIGLVWLAELLNTALETAVDLFCPEYHPLAKVVKDVAAGAVLVAALISVVIGLIIFGPQLFHLLFG